MMSGFPNKTTCFAAEQLNDVEAPDYRTATANGQ
jgi:hypothetical protein